MPPGAVGHHPKIGGARRLARSLRICSPEAALRSRARIPLEGVARVATSAATSLADRRKFMVRVPENPPQGCPVSLLAASRYNPWAPRSVVQIHSPRFAPRKQGAGIQAPCLLYTPAVGRYPRAPARTSDGCQILILRVSGIRNRLSRNATAGTTIG